MGSACDDWFGIQRGFGGVLLTLSLDIKSRTFRVLLWDTETGLALYWKHYPVEGNNTEIVLNCLLEQLPKCKKYLEGDVVIEVGNNSFYNTLLYGLTDPVGRKVFDILCTLPVTSLNVERVRTPKARNFKGYSSPRVQEPLATLEF